MEQTTFEKSKNNLIDNKFIIVLMGLVFLLLTGRLNLISFLIVIGLGVAIWWLNGQILLFLATILSLSWAIIYLINPSWLVYLGNTTYIILVLGMIINLSGEKQWIKIEKIDWEKYAKYFIYFSIICIIFLFGWAAIVGYKNIKSTSIPTEKSWEITNEEPSSDQDLKITINNLSEDKTMVFVLKTPEGKMYSFEKNLDQKNNQVSIYNTLLEEKGEYELTVGDGKVMKKLSFQIK